MSMGLWCSCSEYREDQTVIHPAWPLRRPLHRRIAAGERSTSTNCYQNSAPEAVSYKPRLHNSYLLTNSLTGEPRSSQHDLFTLQQPHMASVEVKQEWGLTADYWGLNEVTPPLSAAVPDTLDLQYDLESKAAKWYATTDIINSQSLWWQSADHNLLSISNTSNTYKVNNQKLVKQPAFILKWDEKGFSYFEK